MEYTIGVEFVSITSFDSDVLVVVVVLVCIVIICDSCIYFIVQSYVNENS